jgi:hypothetical protein
MNHRLSEYIIETKSKENLDAIPSKIKFYSLPLFLINKILIEGEILGLGQAF